MLRDRRKGGPAIESVVAIRPHSASSEPELLEDVLGHEVGRLRHCAGVAPVRAVGQAHRHQVVADLASCEVLCDTQQEQVETLSWFDDPLGPVLGVDLTEEVEDRIELLGEFVKSFRRRRCGIVGQECSN